MLQADILGSWLADAAILVLNLPGQPMTVYDPNKKMTSIQIADIYDRVLFKCCEEYKVDLFDTELIFLSFGYGSLIATTLALNIGLENSIIKNFISFNGIFKVDDRLRDAYTDLSSAINEAHNSMHPKLLDIANNCTYR